MTVLLGKDDSEMVWLGDSKGQPGMEPAGASVARIPTLEIGTILAGKYRVDRMLGRGGMGIVVQAMHLQLEQPVAMKFLLPDVQDAKVVQRFMREAQAAVRLRSEHVARVLDVGALETGAPSCSLPGVRTQKLSRAQLGIGGLIDLLLRRARHSQRRTRSVSCIATSNRRTSSSQAVWGEPRF
jgi:serine/threonine protein kinase